MTTLSKAEQMAEHLSNFVNSGVHDKKAFAQAVTSDHRYLQQEMFNSMLKCIEGWSEASDSGQYDARNEFACKASKVMIEAVNKMYL